MVSHPEPGTMGTYIYIYIHIHKVYNPCIKIYIYSVCVYIYIETIQTNKLPIKNSSARYTSNLVPVPRW